MELKITGLSTPTDSEEIVLRYPAIGTRMAGIIECLEAEPANAEEIAAYIKAPISQMRGLMVKLCQRGLVRHRGKFQYELTDPESASSFYSGLAV